MSKINHPYVNRCDFTIGYSGPSKGGLTILVQEPLEVARERIKERGDVDAAYAVSIAPTDQSFIAELHSVGIDVIDSMCSTRIDIYPKR